MTVKNLIESLMGLPEDMVVLTRSTDHSYRHIYEAGIDYAEFNRGKYYEYFDEYNMSEGGKKVEVYIIS